MLERTDIQLDSSRPTPDWKALYLFNLYRLIVPTVFVGSILVNFSPSFLGQFDKRLFLVAGSLYAGFAILCIITIKQNWPPFNLQVLIQFLLDIFAIMVLMHASGGVYSGLGMLLIVAIAGGSLLTEGRTAFFFAAVASLAVLIHVAFADLYDWFSYTNYTHVGGVHLRYLAQLNAQVVQNIQSGIVVIDILGRIRLFNEAALCLLGSNEPTNGRTLVSVAPELAEQVKNWQNNPSITAPLFRPAKGEVDIIATLMELKQSSILIVLEDATLTAQRVQQLKLASLGRLTASIAHEIRNPLGAISHAGQLLAESPKISPEDQRLTQIIADNSQRVNTIIENVLQLSRQVPADTDCFDLCVWLRSYVDELLIQQNLATSDVLLHTNYPTLMVCFDPAQLYQVLGNLCENGLRYSQGTPLLELTIGLSEKSNRPYLDVQDYGQGMVEEITAQVFEPFFTTESTGTGLGLYLTREICEANQASLHLRSNSHVGCCFRIYFSSEILKTGN